MFNDPDIAAHLVGTILIFGIIWTVLCGALWLLYFVLTLPMRRAERARLFLDLVERALKEGQPVEQAIIEISRTRERAVGLRFHEVAAWLESGLTLAEALAKVPRFLPPQTREMLMAGLAMGDLRKVLPACRQLLRDAGVRTQSATPYVFVVTLFATPVGYFVYVMVVPKFLGFVPEFGLTMIGKAAFVLAHGELWLGAQMAMLAVLLLAAFLYAGGPRVAGWFPPLQIGEYFLPWRRKRMERDFSTMLGVLLDAGASEPEAVRLAADCTANRVFQARAARVIAELGEGIKLPQAVTAMDTTGEFGWRLRNAFHQRTRFLRALQGWHEALDAKAYQLEQTASTWVTTGLVLWNGIFVAALVISVFAFLISIIDVGVLW